MPRRIVCLLSLAGGLSVVMSHLASAQTKPNTFVGALATVNSSSLAQPVGDASPGPSPAGQAGCPTGPPVLLWTNSNTLAVRNGPGGRPAFGLSAPACITQIVTYHWNNGRGATPGKISLQRAPSSGPIVGTFQAVGTAGQNNAPNVNWIADVNPPLLVLPNYYSVIDSDDLTWSRNSNSSYRGFVQVYGICADGTPDCLQPKKPFALPKPAAGGPPAPLPNPSPVPAPVPGPAPKAAPCNLRNGFQFLCFGDVITITPSPVVLGGSAVLTVSPLSGYSFDAHTVIVLEPSAGVGLGVGLRTLCGGLRGGAPNTPCPAAPGSKTMTLTIPNDGSLPPGTYLFRAENWEPSIVVAGVGACTPTCTEADAGFVKFTNTAGGSLAITHISYPAANGQIGVDFTDLSQNVNKIQVRPWLGYQWGSPVTWDPGAAGMSSGEIFISVGGCHSGQSYWVLITLFDAGGGSAQESFAYKCQ